MALYHTLPRPRPRPRLTLPPIRGTTANGGGTGGGDMDRGGHCRLPSGGVRMPGKSVCERDAGGPLGRRAADRRAGRGLDAGPTKDECGGVRMLAQIVLISAAIRSHRNDLAMDYLRRLSLSLGYPTEKEHFLLGNGSPPRPDSKTGG